jgi:hypothetical protein
VIAAAGLLLVLAQLARQRQAARGTRPDTCQVKP